MGLPGAEESQHLQRDVADATSSHPSPGRRATGAPDRHTRIAIDGFGTFGRTWAAPAEDPRPGAVAPRRLAELCRSHGIHLEVRGLRSSMPDYVRFVVGRQAQVRMVPSRSLAALYHGRGRKLAC